MDACIIDWSAVAGFTGAIATIASPIIVAIYLYKKWHDQKGKEVIANEANEILKIVEDLKNDYMYRYGNMDSAINYEELFRREDLSTNRSNSFRNDRKYRDRVSLLLEIIEDKEIQTIQFDIKEYVFQFNKQEMNTDNKEQLEILEKKLNLLVDSLNKLNRILIKYMMYKKEIVFRSKSA
ncbi:MAG: hypothetical protein RR657_07670 [Peptostreptococcaceae bacterium]